MHKRPNQYRNSQPVETNASGSRLRRFSNITLAGLIISAVAGSGLAVPTPAEAAPAEDQQQRAQLLGFEHYTGEIHSHTNISDGQGTIDEAYQHVRDNTDVDFFGLADHDVMIDRRNGDDYVTDWNDAESDEWRFIHEKSAAFNDSQDKLITVPSIEQTWYDGTGHINTYNAPWKVTARAGTSGSVDGFGNSFGTGDLKYDMYTYLARAAQDEDSIVQFNHPSTTSKGNFFDFAGLTPEADKVANLIEIKNSTQAEQFQMALDTGWHLSPTYSGDEHSKQWVTSSPALTGIWATSHTPEGLYEAMQNRRTYASFDQNLVLGYAANDQIMGSILPDDTETLDVRVTLSDPDEDDAFSRVELVGNGGDVLHTFEDVTGTELDLTATLTVADGDFAYVRATQDDGDIAYSAPIWVGETTSGTDFAPAIAEPEHFTTQAKTGESIAVPDFTAIDDSGAQPTTSVEVYNSAGEVAVEGGRFTVANYDDHFVVLRAEDDTGNQSVKLLRIQIDQEHQNSEDVFQYFGTVPGVGETDDSTGLSVTTDKAIENVYAQVRRVGGLGWEDVSVRQSDTDESYEVNRIGRDAEEYIDQITGQTLRSHEFNISGLVAGEKYEYRFGVGPGEPDPSNDELWTDSRGTFLAGGKTDAPVYFTADVQSNTGDPKDVQLHNQVLDQLKSKKPGGETLVQVGDLVDRGGRAEQWQEAFDYILDEQELQTATLVGNHETYDNPDYNIVTNQKSQIFTNMYNLPKNGAIAESNYSFTRGSIHFSVLNSNTSLDKQLQWLQDDIHASESEWNVVVGHFSYYGGRHADDSGMAADRAKVTKSLDELGVDLYVGGHDHVYKRSTILDGRLAETDEEKNLGTTFVTMGSSGPKFYDNSPHWWDEKVEDEDIQMGSVLEATDEGLKFSTYAVDGREIDSITVNKPAGELRLGAINLRDNELRGVSFQSTPGSRDSLTAIAASYDATGKQLHDTRTVDVKLRKSGGAQYVEFESPLPISPNETLKLYVWDSLKNGVPLLKPTLVREGIEGNGTAEEPYLIRTKQQLENINNDPAGHYLLTEDLDFSGESFEQIGTQTTFTGVFDGGGHTVSGFVGTPETGSGLFTANHGTIQNLHVDSTVETDLGKVALLADSNYGTIQNVWVSGSLNAQESAGAIAAYQYGEVLNSYSTANVTVQGFYAGGAVGIARGGSRTEHVYATGRVDAIGRNAGGVVSYGNDETVVHNTVSLNDRVSAPSYAHAIVGRVASGQVADLENNYVAESAKVGVETLTDAPAANNWRGERVPDEQLRTEDFFANLGFDFSGVWQWSENAQRPVLQQVPEEVAAPDPGDGENPSQPEGPELSQDDDGAYLISTADDLLQLNEHTDDTYRLANDIDMSGSADMKLGYPITFSGELDGAGYSLAGFTSENGGLFENVDGLIHDLSFTGANVSQMNTDRTGIITDILNGTLERVSTSGDVVGRQRVGGLVGDSFGTIRDSFSEANVGGEVNRYSGGIIGIGQATSVTERVYSTGRITSTEERSLAGISGYAYEGTVVQDSVALNEEITGRSWAHRIVSRVLDDKPETATLRNNYAPDTLVPSVQNDDSEGGETLNGATRPFAEFQTPEFYQEVLGWDFDTVWSWDNELKRPVFATAAH